MYIGTFPATHHLIKNSFIIYYVGNN